MVIGEVSDLLNLVQLPIVYRLCNKRHLTNEQSSD